ncbi:ion channel [Albibacillus kandeliae]|uniref:ion channel n=1 Tax=Albibacillus kandeliae TaxID=2174228 RepID=UPI000D687536|nr:ion channel [Albibacillus kandeliae]
MLHQLAIGSGLLVLSVLLSGTIFLGLELVLGRFRLWLLRPPLRLKASVMLVLVVLLALGMITASVWLWAAAYLFLGVFDTLEPSLYFSLVCFTTLGFGDIVLPLEWRLLSAMNAANGFLNIGIISTITLEALRRVRKMQLDGPGD